MPTLTVDGYPLAYAEAGSGQPVLMIHGTLGDQRSWSGQMEAFGAKYHAIARQPAPLLAGQVGGRRRLHHRPPHRRHRRLHPRRSALGKVRLIGHSRGGHIAFRVAQHHPDLLEIAGAAGAGRRTR